MKMTYYGLVILLLMSVTASPSALAVIDSGRQYSSTKASKGPDELLTKLNYLYVLYLLPQKALTGTQKKKLDDGLKDLYHEFRLKHASDLAVEIILNTVTAGMSASVDGVQAQPEKKGRA